MKPEKPKTPKTPNRMNDRKVRSFQIEARELNEERRTVDVAFASDSPVERWGATEILEISSKAIRMGRLTSAAPVLMDHNHRDQVGVVENPRIDADGVARATLRFGESVRASEIFQDIKGGIRQKISVGYIIHDYQMTTDSNGKTELRVTDWEPIEISVVSVPADDTVGIGRAADSEQPETESRTDDEGDGNGDDDPNAEPEAERNAGQATTETTEPQPLKEERQMDPEKEKQTAADAVTRERTRISELTAAGRQYADHGGAEIAQRLIDSGGDMSAFNTEVLKRMSTKPQETTKPEQVLTDERDLGKYSVMRALRAACLGVHDKRFLEDAGFELEVSQEYARKQGRDARGIILSPEAVVRAAMAAHLGQRDLNKGSATAGGNLVGTNLLAADFISLLRNRAAVLAMGARTMSGLVGNVAIPKQTGAATPYWVGEGSAPTESAPTFGQIALTPHTVAANVDITRQLLLQSTPDAEGLVIDDLLNVIGLAVDSAALYGLGSSNQPTGLKLTSGINTVDFAADAPTWAEVVQLESEVSADNADIGKLGYLTTPARYGGFKTTAKASNQAVFIADPDGKVNGYNCMRSSQVAANDVWFGNFDDLILGFWSGIDIMSNPYAQGKSGIIEVTAFQDMDVAVRNPQSFCRGNNTL